MKGKMKRLAINLGAIVFIVLLIIYFVVNVNNDLQSSSKKQGFDVLLMDKDFNSLAFQGDILWAGGANGLFKVDRKTLKSDEVGSFKFIRALLITKQGLWVGHDNGLTLIEKNGSSATVSYTTQNGLPDNRVNALMEDKDGSLWVGTWGGAAKFDGKSFAVLTAKDGLLDDMVNVISADNQGGIWFGSYVAPRGGISVLRDGKWQYFTTKDALLHANVNAIIQLNDHSMLCGGGLYTFGGGTKFVFQNDTWVKTSTLTKADGIAGEKVRSLYEDSKGKLWVGSEYDGLAVFATANWPTTSFKLDNKSGLSSNEVKKIVEDVDGNIWLGTRRGITKLTRGVGF